MRQNKQRDRRRLSRRCRRLRSHCLSGSPSRSGERFSLSIWARWSVQANGKYTWLRRKASSYLLRESISVVAERLETHGFIRIHRSVLVNTSFVEEIRPLSTGEYCLRVAG